MGHLRAANAVEDFADPLFRDLDAESTRCLLPLILCFGFGRGHF
jgi:hypothetical protein